MRWLCAALLLASQCAPARTPVRAMDAARAPARQPVVHQTRSAFAIVGASGVVSCAPGEDVARCASGFDRVFAFCALHPGFDGPTSLRSATVTLLDARRTVLRSTRRTLELVALSNDTLSSFALLDDGRGRRALPLGGWGILTAPSSPLTPISPGQTLSIRFHGLLREGPQGAAFFRMTFETSAGDLSCEGPVVLDTWSTA